MIRRALLAIALIVCCVSTVQARARYQGYCERGGNTVSTAGFVSTTNVQASYPLCSYTVFVTGTSNVATIYSDAAGTAKANPSTADANGFVFFYGDDSGYDVTFAPAGVSSWTITNFGGGALTTSGCASNAVCVNTLATGGLGTSGSPWTGWETALNAIAVNSRIHFPAGTYTQATKITYKAGWIIDGDGMLNTVINFTGGGTAWQSINAAAGTTLSSMRVKFSDLTLSCAVTNNGSGFLSIHDAHVYIEHVYLTGFRFGITLMGTETCGIRYNVFNAQSRAGIWIMDSNEYNLTNADQDLSAYGGAGIQLTNAIDIVQNQFASNEPICVIDDGGLQHRFVQNSTNGQGAANPAVSIQPQFWFSHCFDVEFIENDCESTHATNHFVYVSSFTFHSGGAGTSINPITMMFASNNFTNPSGTGASIFFAQGTAILTLINNLFSQSGASASIQGNTHNNTVTSRGNQQGGSSPIFDTIAGVAQTSFDATAAASNGITNNIITQLFVTTGGFNVSGGRLQMFTIRLANNGGQMQHSFVSDVVTNGTSSNISSTKINSASAPYTNTVAAAGADTVDATTPFVGGGGILSINAANFVIDTVNAQGAAGTLMAFAAVSYNDCGTAVLVSPQNVSVNVNGVTENRLLLKFMNASTGAAFSINTANIAAGKTIAIQLIAFVK